MIRFLILVFSSFAAVLATAAPTSLDATKLLPNVTAIPSSAGLERNCGDRASVSVSEPNRYNGAFRCSAGPRGRGGHCGNQCFPSGPGHQPGKLRGSRGEHLSCWTCWLFWLCLGWPTLPAILRVTVLLENDASTPASGRITSNPNGRGLQIQIRRLST